MIRTDGTYKFYKIQHQWKGEWIFSAYPYDQPETNSKTDKFTASGKCWQITGEYGVFNIENARVGLKNIFKKTANFNKNKLTEKTPFRIVRVEIAQKTTPVK